MQTRYEQITELRETATLINQLEFKLIRNEVSISQLKHFNYHNENTGLIDDLSVHNDQIKTELINLKQYFDSQLANIKPYYQ